MTGTWYQMFFDLCIYAGIYYINQTNKKYGKNNKLLIFLIVVFCLYAFWGGDYFHYLEDYISFKHYNADVWMEPVYKQFFQISPSYTFFRFIVWGIGIFFLIFTARNLRIPTRIFIFIFSAFLLLPYSYARVSAGMSILMFGYSIYVKNSTVLLKACGIVIILFSTYFHKSLIMPILVVLFSLIKLNKTTLSILLVGIPVIVMIVRNRFQSIMFATGILNEEQMFKAANYLSGETDRQLGIAALISNILQYIPLFYALYFLTKIFFHSYSNLNNNQKYLYNFSLYMCLGSCCFAFIPNAFVLFYRMLTLTKFPLLFAVCSYRNMILKKQLKLFIMLSLLSSFYFLLYAFYLTI